MLLIIHIIRAYSMFRFKHNERIKSHNSSIEIYIYIYMNACIIYILNACMHMCILHYIISCAYITKDCITVIVI